MPCGCLDSKIQRSLRIYVERTNFDTSAESNFGHSRKCYGYTEILNDGTTAFINAVTYIRNDLTT